MAKNKDAAIKDASEALRDEGQAPPAIVAQPAEKDSKRFMVSLPGTCGNGTIRPAFEVQIDLTLEPGSADVVELIDAEHPNHGVRVKMAAQADAFDAGIKARETAVAAFNRHYGIAFSEHTHVVQQVT